MLQTHSQFFTVMLFSIQLQPYMSHSPDPNQFDDFGTNAASDQLMINLLQDISLFITHELRTPLTSIQGAIGLLNTGQFGTLSEEGKRLLEIATNNAKRLNRLADAIEHQPVSPMTILTEAEVERLQLENELYQAYDLHEFQAFYQPIISTETKQITGFEALARWHHPTKGLISPNTFIPLMEKSELIHRFGMWMLNQACYQLHHWQQQFAANPPIHISVNLSARQLPQANLVQQIEKILSTHHIAPHCLTLEITESALIENLQTTTEIFLELRRMGIQVYIDDFGTGYSSLGRLQELPIDGLKIDRSFIQNKRWNISETIILLAAKLGLEVIAEGIETAEDWLALQALGCQHMQGYFFSKPVNTQMASTLLTSQAYQSTGLLLNPMIEPILNVT